MVLYVSFPFQSFIFSIWKCSSFLCVDLVSCSLAELINSKGLFVFNDFLGSPFSTVMQPADGGFISSFLIGSIISFSCLVALTGTFSTVLSGESRHPCLSPG